MRFYSFLFLAALLLTASCKGPKNPSTASDAQAVGAAGSTSVQVNSTKSSIAWVGFKPGGQHHGTIGVQSGTLGFENGELKSGNFVIDMNNIICLDLADTASANQLVGHLKSADFFDVAKFATSQFTITSVTVLTNDPQNTHEISGNLEMKGITKNITFKAKVAKDGEVYSAITPTFSINRVDWGVNYGSKNIFKDLKDKFINDEIQIQLNIVSL